MNLIAKLGVGLHVVLRGHKPDWSWAQISDWFDWRYCRTCNAKKRRMYD